MANRTKWTDRARKAFLEELKASANVTASAEASGLCRTRVYELRDEDPSFAAEWDGAVEEATDKLEREARRRAVDGWDEPVFHRGIECGRVRKYSDRMLELLLKAHRPDKFKDRSSTEHTGAGGGPITIAVSFVDPADETE